MFAILFFAWASYIEQSNRKNIKILKRKSDDELQILEKPVKKKSKFSLILISVVLPVLTK